MASKDSLYNRKKWEDGVSLLCTFLNVEITLFFQDFPILCETCLGPNPYIRMVSYKFIDKLCKLMVDVLAKE